MPRAKRHQPSMPGMTVKIASHPRQYIRTQSDYESAANKKLLSVTCNCDSNSLEMAASKLLELVEKAGLGGLTSNFIATSAPTVDISHNANADHHQRLRVISIEDQVEKCLAEIHQIEARRTVIAMVIERKTWGTAAKEILPDLFVNGERRATEFVHLLLEYGLQDLYRAFARRNFFAG